MRGFLQSLKSRLKNSIMLSPKLYREYWFFKSNVRYIRRSLVGRNEWKNILKEPPMLAGFNTIGRCNANCCYCAYMFHEPDGIMDMQIYEKGVRDFSDMGGGAIGLSPVTGEPLLDPYLSERIEFASQFNNIENHIRYERHHAEKGRNQRGAYSAFLQDTDPNEYQSSWF